ncbi:MAG: response regulator [Chlorobiaceae bacterium]|nr:response regulator [Chlorobiaceae bacterium]
MIIREKFLLPLKRRAEATVDYMEPYIVTITAFGIFWYIAFHFLLLLFGPKYGYRSFFELRIVEVALALPFLFHKQLHTRLRKFLPPYFISYVLLFLPFFLFYTMMKNEWETNWLLACLSGLTLSILIVSDAVLVSIFFPLAFALSYLAVVLQDGAVSYRYFNAFSITIFVFGLSGSLIISRWMRARHEIRISIMKNLGGAIAHEMREPLNSVAMTIEIIRNTLPPLADSLNGTASIKAEELATLYERIDNGTETIAKGNRIIDSILASISNREIARNDFSYCSARASIEETLETHHFDGPDERRLVHFDGTDDFNFFGDKDLFGHLLANLLKNALFYQYDKPGFRIDISISRSPRSNRIVVRDNGPGIPAGRIDEVFKPFYTFGKPFGNGLGLSFCQKIAEAFGGGISCRSSAGEWTEFTIEFPPDDSGSTREPETESVIMPGMRQALVVDDQPMNHTMISRMVSGLGYHCDTAENGREAIGMAAKKRYDLILLDIEMPVMGGDEACRRLKSGIDIDSETHRHYRDIPIIAVTGLDEAEAERRSSRAGMDGVLLKPLDIRRLREMIALHTLRCRPDWQEDVGQQQDAPARKRTVMIVDDDATSLKLMKTMIESAGYRAVCAKHGGEAIEMLEQYDADLILMDLNMPVMDGFATVTAIRDGRMSRQFRHDADIPVIALTGAGKDVAQKALDAGFNAFLTKPVRHRKLLDTISAWLELPEDAVQMKQDDDAVAGSRWEELESLELFDPEVLRDILSLSKEGLMEELAELFTKDAQKLISELGIASTAMDIEKARRTIHTLKGSAASIGARRLQATASNINEMLKRGHFPIATEWLDYIGRVYRESVEQLSGFVAKGS